MCTEASVLNYRTSLNERASDKSDRTDQQARIKAATASPAGPGSQTYPDQLAPQDQDVAIWRFMNIGQQQRTTVT